MSALYESIRICKKSCGTYRSQECDCGREDAIQEYVTLRTENERLSNQNFDLRTENERLAKRNRELETFHASYNGVPTNFTDPDIERLQKAVDEAEKVIKELKEHPFTQGYLKDGDKWIEEYGGKE
jgi:cell division septum initiation protein DivIVA